MDAPLLERGYEQELARKWRDHEDKKALHELITSHARLVVRIAWQFSGYGLPVGDLIQEGNIGLSEAALRFDPERGVRFSTYASWWIIAQIQEHIIRNHSMVRIGTSPAQKSLFFNLRRLIKRIGTRDNGSLTTEQRQAVAREFKVPLAAVERLESLIARSDRSLNATLGGEDGSELMEFLATPGPNPEEIVSRRHDDAKRSAWLRSAIDHLSARERTIIARRFLTEKPSTLAEIGRSFGVTKERIRQIEGRALAKLRSMAERLPDAMNEA
jgi:RNA polymerase sigma-32 factor